MSNGLKYWNGVRWIAGGAAQLHKIKQDGGWGQHHKGFLSEFFDVIAEMLLQKESEEFAKPILRKVK